MFINLFNFENKCHPNNVKISFYCDVSKNWIDKSVTLFTIKSNDLKSRSSIRPKSDTWL